uniref:Uncharacterized protein n=1 Tax=Heliothis virescens TaxID=7102 RepID=A0A2A4K5E4_HELVI
MALNRLFASLAITPSLISRRSIHVAAVNFASKPPIDKPKPGLGKSYRRIVHFPEEYTVKPLDVTNLAGRDPETGRVIAKGIGGGIKQKYHWIDWVRDGPTEGPPQEEKVIQVMEDGCRTAHIALVAVGDRLKYILATINMKAGDIIKTSRELPRIPVRANEGDAYVLGALPTGTIVHCIEKEPGQGGLYIHAAGTFGTILRKQDDRIIVQMPSKRLFSFNQHCMAVVGRLSNQDHGDTPIGSPQRNRWLGNRPRSGLWQRKSGRHGRKIKPPKPVKEIHLPAKKALPAIRMTMTP